MLNGADYLILTLVGFSALFGLWRGFVKEVFALINWVCAFVLCVLFYKPLGALLPIGETAAWIREAIGAALIFIAVLIVGALLRSMIHGLVKVTGLSGTDRSVGMVFGVFRGAIIILVLLIFLPEISPIAEQNWWQASYLIPKFLGFEDWARDLYEKLAQLLVSLLDSGG